MDLADKVLHESVSDEVFQYISSLMTQVNLHLSFLLKHRTHRNSYILEKAL